MVILGSRKSLIEDDIRELENFVVPAVFMQDEKGMSLKKSIVLSTILHPVAIALVGLILFILMLMGIKFTFFDKPTPKMNDIEFVFVDNAREQMPLNKRTTLHSDRNTRTGGIRDKKRPLSMPSPFPVTKSVQQKSVKGEKVQKPSLQKKIVKQAQPKNIFKSMMQSKSAPEARPQPPSARPSLKPPSVPKPTLKPSSPFTVPVPKPTGATSAKSYSTGPISGQGSSASGGSSSSSGRGRGSYAPVPSLAPTAGGSSGSSGSRLSRSGSGYNGNPGGGGGTPGIDTIRDSDYNAYVKYVERKIQMVWEPPKGNESKTAVIFFKIGKDGRLISRSVSKSSGITNFDQVAVNSIELAAPFKPLPVSYKQSYMPINFTFNHNVNR